MPCSPAASCLQEANSAACTLLPGRVQRKVGCLGRGQGREKQVGICLGVKSKICHPTGCVTLRDLLNLSGPHEGAVEITLKQMWRMGGSAFRAPSTGAGQGYLQCDEQTLGMGEPHRVPESPWPEPVGVGPRVSESLIPELEGVHPPPHPHLPFQKQEGLSSFSEEGTN